MRGCGGPRRRGGGQRAIGRGIGDFRGGGLEPVADGDVLGLRRVGFQFRLAGEAGQLAALIGRVEPAALVVIQLVECVDGGELGGCGGGIARDDEGGGAGDGGWVKGALASSPGKAGNAGGS